MPADAEADGSSELARWQVARDTVWRLVVSTVGTCSEVSETALVMLDSSVIENDRPSVPFVNGAPELLTPATATGGAAGSGVPPPVMSISPWA